MVSVKTIRVTPGQAKKWLAKNDINRPISRQHVNSLVRAIRADEFVENGETIKLNGGERLVDGQHRLTAIVETGRTLPLSVATGVPNSAFDTIDQGRPRSLGDLLARDGVPYATHTATAVRCYWVVSNGLSALKQKMSNPQGVKLFTDNPGIAGCVQKMAGTQIRGLMSLGYAGGLLYACRRKSKKKADEFWEGVSEGVGLEPGAPHLMLRNALIKNRGSIDKMSREFILVKCLKAWKAYATGKALADLRVVKSDLSMKI